jgi:hypothetical protein
MRCIGARLASEGLSCCAEAIWASFDGRFCQATDARRGARLVCSPVKLRGHDMHNRQAGSSAVSEARCNRRALAKGDTSDDALFDSKYRVAPQPRAAGYSAICFVDCLLLIRQLAATALDCMRVLMGPRLASQLLCTGNTSPFRAEIFSRQRSARKKRPQRDGGALGPSCFAAYGNVRRHANAA